MPNNRRDFLKFSVTTVAGLTGTLQSSKISAKDSNAFLTNKSKQDGTVGCLVDITLCTGCRQCEQACNERHSLKSPEYSFNISASEINRIRRPDPSLHTVVNAFDSKNRDDRYVKIQCMHCIEPSCVSACIVGALNKRDDGPVTYDQDKCIGCRYCMIACPFEIPAYEYDEPLTPKVTKCDFCTSTIENPDIQNGKATPSCAAACPFDAIKFGKKDELLALAQKRIDDNPEKYFPHIYGQHEAGGTSWIYLAPGNFKEMGLPDLDSTPPSALTEGIQHGIFKFGAVPAALYGALSALMWFKNRKDKREDSNDR